MTKIVSVHSRKGGVGKTTVAYELAWLLGGVLVDLEWDHGSASRQWGYRHESRANAPLVDAFERRRTPRPLRGHGKPQLIPGHPTLGAMGVEAEEVAKALRDWANDWDTDWVVVDTHPGSNPWSDGANAVADIVLAPVPLKTKELEAIAGMVDEMADYPLVLVPNMVPRVPEAGGVSRLAAIVEGTPVRVGPLIPRADAVGNRRKRMAITAEGLPAKALQSVAEALKDLARYVRNYPNV
ncbi:MAG: ParA family protein [Chloroflexota bacterium]|nr:ParA family protein [Chloroflexota bacterium]